MSQTKKAERYRKNGRKPLPTKFSRRARMKMRGPKEIGEDLRVTAAECRELGLVYIQGCDESDEEYIARLQSYDGDEFGPAEIADIIESVNTGKFELS